MYDRIRLLRWFAWLPLLAAGCGTPGAPQPPSLRLPRPVEDLQAVRVGDSVHLSWTAPVQTTDGDPIREAGVIRVCRGIPAQPEAGCTDKVSELPFRPSDIRQTARDDLRPFLQGPEERAFLVYIVEAENSAGRRAGPSNSVTVFLAPGLPRPESLRSTLGPESVELRWSAVTVPQTRQAVRFHLRVKRLDAAAPSGTAPTILADLSMEAVSFADATFEWEKGYLYSVSGVTEVLALDGSKLGEFESEPAAPVPVQARDSFAPATPSAVQAVFTESAGGGFIDLTWTPNQERDLAGYVVTRTDDRNESRILTPQPVATPAFRDTAVEAGRTYRYYIMAVDVRGNASAPSAPATETVPGARP